MGEIIELRVCSVSIDENGFCIVDVKPLGVDMITEQDAVEVCESIYEICEQKRTPVVFDLTRFKGQFAPNVREIFRYNEKFELIKYNSAVILNSLGNRLFVNFYMSFNKPNKPMKVFSSREKGVGFLLEGLNG